MNAQDDRAMQALSDAGAQCGECGDQPGDRTCPDCEECYQRYVAELRTAGWAPRTEVLREAADKLALALTADSPTLPGYPLAVRSAVRSLRRMAAEAVA